MDCVDAITSFPAHSRQVEQRFLFTYSGASRNSALVITLEEPGIRSGENAVGETRLVLREAGVRTIPKPQVNGRSQEMPDTVTIL